MAGKWKMLKAFARALEGPEAVEKRLSGNKLVNEIDNRVNDAVQNAFADNDITAFEARGAGRRSGFDDNEGIPKSRVDINNRVTKIPANERQAAFDDFTDKTTDKSLQNDFDKALDEAIKYNTKHDPQRGRWTEEEVREGAIEFLKGGAKIEDVMDFLRGKIDYVEMKD